MKKEFNYENFTEWINQQFIKPQGDESGLELLEALCIDGGKSCFLSKDGFDGPEISEEGIELEPDPDGTLSPAFYLRQAKVSLEEEGFSELSKRTGKILKEYMTAIKEEEGASDEPGEYPDEDVVRSEDPLHGDYLKYSEKYIPRFQELVEDYFEKKAKVSLLEYLEK